MSGIEDNFLLNALAIARISEILTRTESNPPVPPSDEYATDVNTIKLSHRWTINNFGSVLRLSSPEDKMTGKVLISPEFPDVSWQINLYPAGKRTENAGNVSLFLKMSSNLPDQETRVKAEYRFFFLNDNEEQKFSNVNVGEFHVKPMGAHSWGLRNIPTPKVQNALRKDGSLAIQLVIEIIPDVSKMERPVHEAPIDNKISPTMRQLLSNPGFYPSPPIPAVDPTLEPKNDFPEDMEVMEEDVATVPPSNEHVTDVNIIKLSHRWTVINFDTVLRFGSPGDKITGDALTIPGFPDVCWQLVLYPGGKREENAGHVSLFLKMSARTPEKEARVKAGYQFMFLNDNEEKVFTNINVGEFHAQAPKGGHSWGLRNIPRAKVERALRNDGSLVIQLEIEIIPNVFETKPKVHEAPIDNLVSSTMQLSKSFSTLSLAPIPTVEPTPESMDDLPEDMEVIMVEEDVAPKIDDEFDAELIN
ncbi:unnamed protein product [Caenorhabditis nigoni]